jgi:hypothetical protein
MTQRDGRVTILPEQVRRLAELSQEKDCAIEIVQRGSVLIFFDGSTKLSINARGNPVNTNPDQETLC